MTKATTAREADERRYARFATGSVGFVERHGLWSEDQRAAARPWKRPWRAWSSSGSASAIRTG